MLDRIINTLSKIIESLFPIIKTLLPALVLVFTLIALVYGFIRLVEYIAKKEVHDPNTIKELVGLIRPILLFNSKEIIISDHGAMNHIKSFAVELNKTDNCTPPKIIFNFKKHLQTAPLVESIDMFKFQITAEKGKYNTWIFILDPLMTCDEVDSYKFRLEILN